MLHGVATHGAETLPQQPDAVDPPALSVIVPTLDEACALPALLHALRRQQGVDADLIVADGGSTDATAAIAKAHGARVVTTAPGRGRQMNAAARAAQADYLLFLHADSQLTGPDWLAAALAAFERALRRAGHDRVAGHFPLRFQRTRRGHALTYRFMEAKSRLNRRNTTNGDQGCLLTRRFFEALGGFDERLPFLEDQRLAERIRARGEWITLPGMLITSARRFEAEGLRRRYILMALTMGLHEAGLDEFFRRAPQLYAAQAETRRLRLTPFMRLMRNVLRRRPWRERVRMWLRTGSYVRENGWQLFLLIDLIAARAGPCGGARTPALKFYDRWLARALANPVVDACVAVLVYVWVMGVLRGWFRLTERGTCGSGASRDQRRRL